MTIIHLVRHGKTSFTGTRIAGYLAGVHLTDEGKEQADRVARYLENSPITAVYASPLERAMETAAPVAEKLNLDIRQVDFLKEINFGRLQGMGEELADEPTWQIFQRTPSRAVFPEGESVVAAQMRVVAGLNWLSQIHAFSEEIVCVSHCEAIRLALAFALQRSLENFAEIPVDTASVSKVFWEPENIRVVSVNFIPRF